MFRRAAVLAIGLVVLFLVPVGGCTTSEPTTSAPETGQQDANVEPEPIIPEPGLPIDIIDDGGTLIYKINGAPITTVNSAVLDARFAHNLNFWTVINTANKVIKAPRSSDTVTVQHADGTGYTIKKHGNSLEWQCIGAEDPISATGGDNDMPACMQEAEGEETITLGAFDGDWIHVDVAE